MTSEKPPRDMPLGKPRAHHIDSRADVEKFRQAQDAGEVSENDLIFFGEELSRELGLDKRPIPPGKVVIIASKPKSGTKDD